MAANYFNGLVLIKPQYTGNDRDTPENVTWWKGSFSTGLTLAQMTAIQAIFDPAWGAMWKEIGAASATYTGSIIQDFSSNTGLEQTSVGVYAGQAGTQGSDIGSNTACLISHLVAVRFKGGHGRTYLPSCGASALTNGKQFVAAQITAVTSGYATLVTNMGGVSSGNGGPFTQQLFRYRNYPGSAAHPIHTPASLVAVTSNSVSQTPASQRRRVRRASHE